MCFSIKLKKKKKDCLIQGSKFGTLVFIEEVYNLSSDTYAFYSCQTNLCAAAAGVQLHSFACSYTEGPVPFVEAYSFLMGLVGTLTEKQSY